MRIWFYFSWKIENEQIIKTPGVIFGVATAIRAVTNPDDAVLICQPVYHLFNRIIKCNGHRTVVSELVLKNRRYEIDFDDFKRKIREENVKAFLLCSPHNPIGRVWTKEELEKIAEICLDNGVYIISDEIHSDFVYEGHVHIPFATLSSEIADRTITCILPSKTFNIAGLQAANVIVTNSQLWQLVKNECVAMGYSHLNNMATVAAKAAYKYGSEWLDAVLKYLRENIDIVRVCYAKQ